MPPRRQRSEPYGASAFSGLSFNPLQIVSSPPVARIHVPGTGIMTWAPESSGWVLQPSGGTLAVDIVDPEPRPAAAARQSARALAPVVRIAARASLTTALDVASSAAARQAALDDFDADVLANSSKVAKAGLWNTWSRLHRAWFGDARPVVPLQADSIRAVAALFKAGHYTSFINYITTAKAHHIAEFDKHCVAWSDELSVNVRNAIRSVNRGVGPSKQSQPVDIVKILQLKLADVPLSVGGPIGPAHFCVLGVLFMAREIEVSTAKIRCISFDMATAEISWTLPVSKNDVRAVGTTRTWGCTCTQPSTTMPCAFHAGLLQFDLVRALALLLGRPFADMPVFPTAEGLEISKAAAVATITMIMGMTGATVVDHCGRPKFGGHSLRTGGAVFLTHLGLDSLRIESMARWHSPMLMLYTRSAPLRSITREFNSAAQSHSNNPIASRSIQRTLDSLMNRLDKFEEDKLNLFERLEAMAASNCPPKFIRNRESDKWHESRCHEAGQACFTICGWNYTGLGFDAATALPADLTHRSFCGTCMPARRLLGSCD